MRFDAIQSFLGDTDFANAQRGTLAGDASARRYERLTRPDSISSVLMIAPPENSAEMRAFFQVAEFLRGRGLSSPKIYKMDLAAGLMLLQDFGDNLFFNVAENNSNVELEIYLRALDVLPFLDNPDQMFANETYQKDDMVKIVADLLPWYAPELDIAEISENLDHALSQLDWSRPRLALRDYHAQNLIWMPDRAGVKAVGLLDFQSAQISHPLYDAASLLIDARRDVSKDVVGQLIGTLKTTHKTADDFDTAFWTLSAQRNLRIIGIFARLNARDKKPAYLDLLPRVWRNFQMDVANSNNPNLAPILKLLPPPSTEYIAKLRAQI